MMSGFPFIYLHKISVISFLLILGKKGTTTLLIIFCNLMLILILYLQVCVNMYFLVVKK